MSKSTETPVTTVPNPRVEKFPLNPLKYPHVRVTLHPNGKESIQLVGMPNQAAPVGDKWNDDPPPATVQDGLTAEQAEDLAHALLRASKSVPIR